MSDNGPQFVSIEFQKFVRDWDIEHFTISPHNSKANGKVEAAVKSAKQLLRKTIKGGEDQYLALLAHRNTPTQGVGTSPAQRLMNREQEPHCQQQAPSYSLGVGVTVKERS